MEYVIHYDVAALVIIITVMLHFFLKKTINTRQNGIFSLLIILALLSNVLDIVSIQLFPYAQKIPMAVNYAVNEIYLISFNATSAVYYIYIYAATKKEGAFRRFDGGRMLFPIFFEILLILSTPWTHLIFYFDKSGAYRHGGWMVALYLISMIYVLMSLFHTFLYRMKLNRAQKISVYIYTLFCIGALVMQMRYPKVMMMQFAVSVAVLLIYLTLENPEDYMDKQIGVYNRVGFTRIASQYINQEKAFEVLGIRIDGYRDISETISMENAWILLRKVAEYLLSVTRHKKVCYLSDAEFAVVSEKTKGGFDTLGHLITERFGRPFSLNGIEISLSAQMCLLDYPEDAENLEDVMDALEYALQELALAKGGVLRVSEEILRKKRRESQILQILKKAVKEERFEVYYQPIYSVERETFSAAEALIRLQSEEFGFISPEEFIPMAEKNGLIVEIGEYVFRSVCAMMQRELPWKYGIDYIEVNLSAVQCMQEGLHLMLFQIMDQYRIPYERINLEITETAAVISKERFWKNMQELLAGGVSFSLDDYGTGFSNTSTIISYPFFIVKLDKSMVWSAMKSEKAMCALKYTAAMIKEMGIHLVAEGVETAEQAEKLKEMGCDFFQGYYYAKPLPAEQFLKLIGKPVPADFMGGPAAVEVPGCPDAVSSVL